eukprot:11198336-Lingulodinium_polyedra.AAC.1
MGCPWGARAPGPTSSPGRQPAVAEGAADFCVAAGREDELGAGDAPDPAGAVAQLHAEATTLPAALSASRR